MDRDKLHKPQLNVSRVTSTGCDDHVTDENGKTAVFSP
jgi:hypothetical protein